MSSISSTEISPSISNSPPGSTKTNNLSPESNAYEAGKKVTFNNILSLPTSDSSDIDDDEDHHLTNTSSRISSNETTIPQFNVSSADNQARKSSKKYGLKKLDSYPMSKTQSTDSMDSNTTLPEFNKRPLTDTPVVSSVASPDYNSEDVEELDSRLNDVNRQRDAQDREDDDKVKITRLKNISHLNLMDLKNNSSQSLSPTSTPAEPSDEKAVEEEKSTEKEPKHKSTNVSDEPLRKTVSEMTPIMSNNEFEIPLHLQEKFKKTASLEKLKTLLKTKPTHKKAYTLNIPGQTSSKTSPDGRIANVDVGSKLVIVMVGLPARGKSYITNKLTRYLNWLQHDCRVFNVGNTRRLDKENNNGPEDKPLPDNHTPNNEVSSPKSPGHNADFFSPDNYAYTALREKWAMDTLEQLLDYVLDGSGSVGIFDATNSTKHRRLRVLKRIQQRSNGELKVLFLESVCTDPALIESNIRLKLSGPDYRDMDPEIALKDFVGRLRNYEKAYEPIDELEEKIPGFQYVKMIDVGKKVVSYNVQGFLASQTIYFLLNFNLCERQIWITRHGESVDNLSGKIGGDSHLTKRGKNFSKTLAKFMNFQRQEFRKNQLEAFSNRLELKYLKHEQSENDSFIDEEDPVDQIPTEPNFYVWTSMLTRAVETGQYFDDSIYSIKQMRMLNELGGGKFEGLTYEEIQTRYPKEYLARIQNKLTYRYPGVGGESYLDVLTRLRPLINEIERTTDHLLLVSHRVVLRILLAYFLNLDRSAIGELDVPLHTLYCLESKPYGTDYRMYEYDESLDWFVKVEPEHQKNVKEVGVLFKQRKYSVVPTAPPSSSSNTSTSKRRPTRQTLRRSLSQGFTKGVEEEEDDSLSSKKLNDLNKLRIP